ncbi:hypothetical protein [Inhella proteolytica]|uniref:Uncharacterized protein n=1 Tax=Inhella proteolytica TaxID=2795029 RepID=A0A931NJP0_9BURK|nr:hypothetical protein [Inhella proteolytica]MBH9579214.1 hypothetical protein [Inhella proteolytica]
MPTPAPRSGARPAAGAFSQERRSGSDRRQRDEGPPRGLRERRVHMEARRPQVEELEMTLEEFQRLLEQTEAPQLDEATRALAERAQIARDRHRN